MRRVLSEPPNGLELILPILQQAVAHANAGRWAEAEKGAQRVLKAKPLDPSALNILGTVAMNTGRSAEAIVWLQQAAGGQPKNPFIQFNLGEAHRRIQAYEIAAKFFQRAAALKPDFAEAHASSGDIYRLLGQRAEAERSYRAALQQAPAMLTALNGLGLLQLQRGDAAAASEPFEAGCKAAPAGHPLRPILLANLGLVRLQLGHGSEGLGLLAQSVEAAPEDAEAWRRLAAALRHTRVAPAMPGFRDILLQLFDRSDVNPRNLATAALAVLRQDPDIDQLLETIVRAPRDVAQTLEHGAAAATRLLHDTLFRRLLASAPIPDVGIELLLVQLRADLLRLADAEPEALEDELGLAVALGRQSFLNEYVAYADAVEQQRLNALVAALDREDLGAGAGDAAKVAVLAAYRPLASTPLAARLQANPLPALADVLREQLAEPAEEAELRAALPVLKPPSDTTSLAVQTQYEENPYPRWTRCSLGEALPFRKAIQSALPDLPTHEIPDLDRPRVLVAGCGTGLETMRVATTYRGASILAIDLSATSLAYAKRKTRAYGLAEVEHLQADILDLPTLQERFDLIDSFGVLHHMANPAQGLQVLAGLLRPDGVLFVGLYSEIGRRAVVEARAHNGAARRPSSVAPGLRRLRADACPRKPWLAKSLLLP